MPDKLKVLLDLKAAFDGHAGIPQDTRLVFKAISQCPIAQSAGLLLGPGKGPMGFKFKKNYSSIHKKIYKQAQYFVRLEGEEQLKRFQLTPMSWPLQIPSILLEAFKSFFTYTKPRGFGLMKIESDLFNDYIWRAIFSKSLASRDRSMIEAQNYYGVGLSGFFLMLCHYSSMPTPSINTKGHDVFIMQNPQLYKVHPRTKLIVRYHDSIPITHPHVIHNAGPHMRGHYKALKMAVKKKAHFVCNSEPTREVLCTIFPELEKRSSVIGCIVPSHYQKTNALKAVPNIILNKKTYDTLQAKRAKDMLLVDEKLKAKVSSDYLLAVGTMEPRKNYPLIISAWERLCYHTQKDVSLVLVANRGWKQGEILKAMLGQQMKGNLFHLERVSAYELKILYSHCKALICASEQEGLGLPGLEAMACEAPVIASDIAAHRWAYGRAATYFDKFSAQELYQALNKLLYSEDARSLLARQIEEGKKRVAFFRESTIHDKWNVLLENFLPQ